MPEPMNTRRAVLMAAALTILVVSFVALRAQQPAGRTPAAQQPAAQQPAAQQPPQQPPAGRGGRGGRGGPPPKPLVPVVASTVAANPDAYYGQTVTMTASVDQILSPTAFTLDQDKTKSTGQDVLIIPRRLNAPVDLNAYVTVFGEVVKFDPAALAEKAKDFKVDLPPDVVAKYQGHPAVLATTVLNSKMVDLAMRLPPPMTEEEQALNKIMKRVGPAFAALRPAVDGSKMEVVKENAGILKQAFDETEDFWKDKDKDDAQKWAHEAKQQAEAIDRDVASGKWDAVKASAATLGQQCQACHTAYRERFDDGSFRIKKGGGK